jgi:hypothetical protein
MARIGAIARERRTMKLTPKQLELTADRTREELLIQALPPHIDPESATFKADLAKVNQIEREDAARAVLGSGFAFQQEEIPEEESTGTRTIPSS